VAALLDALDQVLNSNTFLLKLPGEVQKAEELERLLCGEDLTEALLDEDIARGWLNYSRWEMVAGQCQLVRGSGRFVRPAPRVRARSLTWMEVRSRLVGFLVEGWSPYDHRLPRGEAVGLVEAFEVEWAAGEEGKYWEVQPDFLVVRGTDDGGDLPEGSSAYFDGFASDSCTVLSKARTTWVLLTNGSD
jgi:hypothetical protein